MKKTTLKKTLAFTLCVVFAITGFALPTFAAASTTIEYGADAVQNQEIDVEICQNGKFCSHEAAIKRENEDGSVSVDHYAKLADAIADVPADNVETTIYIMKDISVNAEYTIAPGQNIVIDGTHRANINSTTTQKAILTRARDINDTVNYGYAGSFSSFGGIT